MCADLGMLAGVLLFMVLLCTVINGAAGLAIFLAIKVFARLNDARRSRA